MTYPGFNKLNHSHVDRYLSGRKIIDPSVTLKSYTGSKERRGIIVFGCNLGSKAKMEPVSLTVSSLDFDDLAKKMFEADREAALRAFGQAIISS
ncbi:hypothetical protein HJC06_10550 [Rhizobium sp. NLR9b]|uniref:hypothetical protein n=1 Tax=unclassified Rhizobium TaxID=2613769 RepID=UPI001C82F01A|nr:MULTISPECIES: hypothetical protein [unclassified Rhizobium]MBX5226864.1 hypothetical protein [Rhizobium sp. NLR9b]MBX5287535.1 hypothetical protein [Rhizobium sp. NLR10b]